MILNLKNNLKINAQLMLFCPKIQRKADLQRKPLSLVV